MVQTQEDWDLGDERGDEHLVAVAANHGHHRIRGPCRRPQHHVRYGHLGERRSLSEASLSTIMYIKKEYGGCFFILKRLGIVGQDVDKLLVRLPAARWLSRDSPLSNSDKDKVRGP
jgi:hypothetical protein